MKDYDGEVTLEYSPESFTGTELDYALEVLPKELYDNRNFKKLRISYKMAVKSGEEILCKYCELEGRHICCIFGTDGTLRTQIEFD